MLNQRIKPVYFKDDMDLRSLEPLRNLLEGNYFTMMFDSKCTLAISPTAESIYQKNRQNWFRLKQNKDSKLYTLIYETNKNITFVPEGEYEYLIILNDNLCDLKIGRMPHFYLNDKMHNSLIVAGDISFKKVNDRESEIEYINDKSGGYHLTDTDKPILEVKKESILKAIAKVGLPLDKFTFKDFPLKQIQRQKSF